MSIIKCKVYAKALEAWKEWYLKYSFSKIKLITIWLSMIKLVGVVSITLVWVFCKYLEYNIYKVKSLIPLNY